MNVQTGSLTPATMIAGDVALHRDVMVTMRDGVRLATDIYRPAPGGVIDATRLPVIFERTPYDKAGTPRSELAVSRPEPLSRADLAIRLARRGYVVVWQDCRGRYGSEGEFTKYLNEAEDGYDAMTWLAAQPWNNGRIATMGLSYDAHTQMSMACLNPPGLVAMAVDSGGFSDAFTCGVRQGGAFEMKQATWAYNRGIEGSDPVAGRAIAAESLRDWFRVMPWTKGRSPVRWNPEYEGYLLEQWQNGTFGDFWKQPSIYAKGYYATFPKVPIVFMSSWYDAYVTTTIENYTGLKGDPERPLALVMGPWTHGSRSRRVFGDVDFGPAAVFDGQVDEDWLVYRETWFDTWLKGEAPAAPQAGRVHLFLMGTGSGRRTPEGRFDHGGRWIEAADWPVPGDEALDLFLTADMGLATEPPAADSAAISYDFDPRHPVPTIGGALTSGEPIFTGGGFNQVEGEEFFGCTTPGMPLSARADVLSFETEPLEEDTAIVGDVAVDLWVSTDAPDTDFTAKLVDVYPPSDDYPRGYALNITDGIFRVRYRNGFDAPEPVAGTEPFPIAIKPFATANLFKKGHRIRLDISSSNFPKYDVNPNTGAPEATGRTTRVALNTVFLERGRPSVLKLRRLPGVGR